ncbi:MAG: hypothetical protein SGJ27_30690 [Candidatus Melainabacteria bacterium]|nr:hypothetical protein [Candidatus Melainabacteria bacterium]
MFWSFKENTGALEHFFKGLHRAVFRVPVTKHFDLLSQKTDQIKLLLDDDNQPITCKGCGYAIVRQTYPDGWEVESCSSITAPQLVNNKKFDDWVESIPKARVTTEVR